MPIIGHLHSASASVSLDPCLAEDGSVGPSAAAERIALQKLRNEIRNFAQRALSAGSWR
jgi:hypothetical protein